MPIVYYLEVNPIYEYEGGGLLMYYSKGHHAPADFARDLQAGWDVTISDLSKVKQGYFRCVPTGQKGESVLWPAKQGERGAWPVTLIDRGDFQESKNLIENPSMEQSTSAWGGPDAI